MKKYKFKLASLLKIREFKEKKIKIELGKIVKTMDEIRKEIQQMNDDIDEAYEAQENLAENTVQVRHLQFFPFFWGGKQEDIKVKENLLFAYQKKYDELVKDLTVAMGEVKVIEKIKEKDLKQYNKESNREEILSNEEKINMRFNSKWKS